MIPKSHPCSSAANFRTCEHEFANLHANEKIKPSKYLNLIHPSSFNLPTHGHTNTSRALAGISRPVYTTSRSFPLPIVHMLSPPGPIFGCVSQVTVESARKTYVPLP